jgi:acyl carrier protein
MTEAPAMNEAAAVLQIVREVLAAYTPETRLTSAPPDEVSLHSLSIASVDMIGVIIELEDRFGEVIDESRVHDLRTVADLVTAIEEACACRR